MEKRTEEWLRQSDYDMDTALYMYEGGRFIVNLNEASIPTRYPESLANLQRVYSRVVVRIFYPRVRNL